jgi:putative colanic acid biosynthesis acetyltransferase WcaF
MMATNAMKVPRNLLLRLFGAKIPLVSLVYPSSRIWAPWNLSMGEYACIGPDTEIYNKAPISIGSHAVISQGTFLCTASHDISDPGHALVTAPITVEDRAWVAAQAFVGMGVTIGTGAVVGARSTVFRDVAPWTVVGGNPAKFIKQRTLR